MTIGALSHFTTVIAGPMFPSIIVVIVTWVILLFGSSS